MFFEAREVADARQAVDPNPRAAMHVGAMCTLTAPAGDGKAAEQKVLLIGNVVRGLLIDPQKCAVERVVPGARAKNLFCVQEGSLYWSMEGSPGPMYRIGFPDFKRETIHRDGQFTPGVIYDGQIYLWNASLSVAKSFKDTFQSLRGNLPDPSVWWWEVFPSESRHYGLVLFAHGKSYQVEVRRPAGAAETAVPIFTPEAGGRTALRRGAGCRRSRETWRPGHLRRKVAGQAGGCR